MPWYSPPAATTSFVCLRTEAMSTLVTRARGCDRWALEVEETKLRPSREAVARARRLWNPVHPVGASWISIAIESCLENATLTSCSQEDRNSWMACAICEKALWDCAYRRVSCSTSFALILSSLSMLQPQFTSRSLKNLARIPPSVGMWYTTTPRSVMALTPPSETSSGAESNRLTCICLCRWIRRMSCFSAGFSCLRASLHSCNAIRMAQ
mmetsp:Transcript_6106/g.21850  ORF Transcript_6106/g.21850 Transcript_6106/m.21850 type:complete len:211 (+) Transcript_6106:1694-2326(+)